MGGRISARVQRQDEGGGKSAKAGRKERFSRVGECREELLAAGFAGHEYGCMVPYSHMKTTIDIPDALFTRLKTVAAKEKTTMKSLIVAAIRDSMRARKPVKGFKLRDASFGGDGLRPGVDLRDWDAIRDMMYEGRGS